MSGITGVPGQNSFVTSAIGFITAGVSGDGALGFGLSIHVISMPGSLRTFAIVSPTASADSPGSTRQLTVALAICGNALSAWPPSSRVATQVVRNWLLY